MQRPSIPYKGANWMQPPRKSWGLPTTCGILLSFLLRPEIPCDTTQASLKGQRVQFGETNEALPPDSSWKRPQLRSGCSNDNRLVHFPQGKIKKL